ncbi:MAG: transcriptional regulator [Candidatus Delongbacteria bacterium]|nr:transcriptional regulator [Candidatus Delongbacteria bacterium]MCG2761135.1 transcriptional regulator [Candidatus Delongbacteria bacterium]
MYKVIKNEKQYLEYLDEFEKLMELDPDNGTEDGDKFDLLALLINEYEEKHYKIELPDPVEAIKFRMDQMGLKNKDLVGIIGSKSKVSEVLNGKIKLSLNMIKALNAKLGIPVEVLIKDTDYYKMLENDVTKLRVAEDKANYGS